MKTIDYKEMGVWVLDCNESAFLNGGQVLPVSSPTLTAIVNYVKFCMDTGGQYVIHHAQ